MERLRPNNFWCCCPDGSELSSSASLPIGDLGGGGEVRC